ncbi:MAG: hypothetical protein KDJ86_01685 [Bauldia sp.]|uniref:hypothetical protein n=1 Tax=Bauldia sp. TaxID=2575872 RepID=UPI001DC61A10|nr:hypothetical protein [Bauldia sp.]MCB1494470.1 hypothetical protein [Bauldia sp.]
MVADIATYIGDEKDNNESGSYMTMYGYDGNDQLSSTLTAAGFVKIYGGDDNDTLAYYGMGQVKQIGGNGNDWAAGGAYDDVLNGGNGKDFLQGFDGNDKLKGGKGGDWLFGGLGLDWMKGGKGKDHYGFNTTPDSKTNVDMIVDFNVKQDYLHFNHNVFMAGFDGTMGEIKKKYFALGKGPKDGNDYFGYNEKNGYVWTDQNGSDPGGFDKVAKLDAHLHLTFHNFMFD